MEEILVPVQYKGFDLEISAYIHRNSDQCILCLHGLQSNKDIFKNVMINSFLKDYSILMVDFIGFGNSSKPKEFSYELMDQAKVIRAIITSLKMRNIHLIGHSMGGMIGILLLDMIPKKIISLINLEGNLVLEDCETSKDVGNFTFEEFHTFGFQKIKDEIRESNEKSAKCRETWLNQIPDYAFYNSSLSIVTWSKRRRLLSIFMKSKHKKLFVYGDKNKFKTNPLTSKIQLAEIPHAGHFMMIDNAKSCAEQIEQFLHQ